MQDEKLPGPKMAEINGYIDEYTAKCETKEYAESFLHFRRNIERLFDDGYRVVDEEKDGHLYQMTNLLSPIEKMVLEREREKTQIESGLATSRDGTIERVPQLIKVPSQKLSTLIKRRNTKIKNESKK